MHDEKNVERVNLRSIPWHPFIAGIYDCIADSRNMYLLQELAHGGTLSERIRASRTGLPADVCRFYFGNIVLALEYVHSLGLVHGDVKPDNFFVGGDGYLMLGDFGLTSKYDEEREWGVIATQAYMSPEFGLEQYDMESKKALDWWAAGCTLFEMATGKMVRSCLHSHRSACD